MAIANDGNDCFDKHKQQNKALHISPNNKILRLLMMSDKMPIGISAIIFDAFIITISVANLLPEKPFWEKYVI